MDKSTQILLKAKLNEWAADLKYNAEGNLEMIGRANELEDIAGQELFTKRDVIQMLRPIVECNDEIQELVSNNNYQGSSRLLKAISDLDWTIRNLGVKENG